MGRNSAPFRHVAAEVGGGPQELAPSLPARSAESWAKLAVLCDPAPNEAYEVEPANYPAGWFTVRCNGIPVGHAARREAAER